MKIHPKAQNQKIIFIKAFSLLKFNFKGSFALQNDQEILVDSSSVGEIGEFENEYFKIYVLSKKDAYIKD